MRTNRGGEFTSNVFKRFCFSNGIIQHLTCSHTPQQNGVAERKHRHLVECALTMLSHSQLPPSYWSYAISTVVHIINRLPTPTLNNQTPWELLFLTKPDTSHLKTFGCVCFPLLKPYNSNKLQPHITSCIFLGYPPYTKGYICLNPITSWIYISRHVLFNEHDFSPSLSLSSSPTAPHPAQSSTSPFLLSVSDTTSTPSSIPSQPALWH